MKTSAVALLVPVALSTLARAASDEGSPIGKVLAMISDLQGKVIKEGEAVQKEYAEFSEWCEDRAKDLDHEIETGKAAVGSLKSTIDEETSTIASATTRVEELTASIATNEADLKAGTSVREKERSDFVAEEKELMETIDMIGRATAVLEREMAKGGASMLQAKSAGNLAQALSAMVQASMIGSSDAAKLTAFVQSAQQADDADTGAPAGAVYESKSGGVVDVLQDLSEKAEAQLDDARKKETASLHEFEMLKQSLTDEIKFATKDLDETKKAIAAAEEKKSTAEGDLTTTSKELAADVESKSTLHHDCMTKAADFEAETKSRGEELTALATAKKVIEEATSLAQVSLIQVRRSRIASGADLANFEAVRMVRDLARKHQSGALAQLASRMTAAFSSRGGSRDPFAKVKGLITDMIAKLEGEATADATKKAYCDKELAETNAKKEDKSDDIGSLTTQLDQATAKSAKLKEEVAALENELSKLSKSQAEMDKMRAEQKATYTESKAELEKGLKGLQLALKVLKEYYAKDSAHGSAGDSAGGIISLIEVCESDFSKELAEITSEEESAVAEYEATSKDNELEKKAKDQDVKYKVKESKELDKTAAELTSDRSGVQTELDAVLEYLRQIEADCIAKPETYAERKEAREAEIAGLKEALETLESETALLQRRARRRTLRGADARLVPSA